MSGDEKPYVTLQSSVEYPPHIFAGYKKRKEKKNNVCSVSTLFYHYWRVYCETLLLHISV